MGLGRIWASTLYLHCTPCFGPMSPVEADDTQVWSCMSLTGVVEVKIHETSVGFSRHIEVRNNFCLCVGHEALRPLQMTPVHPQTILKDLVASISLAAQPGLCGGRIAK